MTNQNIKKTVHITLALVFSLMSAIHFSACKSAPKSDSSGGVTNSDLLSGSTDDNTMGDSDSGRAMGLSTVYFAYDSYELDSGSKATIQANAAVFKQKSSLKVQIEGHCDQRGGIQYNIALGEKRANAVKKMLIDLGVSAQRLSIISYGKERPIDSAETETAYAKNRRANFVITSK